MKKYSCYLIEAKSLPLLEALAGGYTYKSRRADHVTAVFGASEGDLLPQAKIEVYGFARDGQGIEAFLVQVDGQRCRPDGGYYHLTWSLDPKKQVSPHYGLEKPERYAAKHANAMLKAAFEDAARFVELRYFAPVEISATPAHVVTDKAGNKQIRRFLPE